MCDNTAEPAQRYLCQTVCTSVRSVPPVKPLCPPLSALLIATSLAHTALSPYFTAVAYATPNSLYAIRRELHKCSSKCFPKYFMVYDSDGYETSILL